MQLLIPALAGLSAYLTVLATVQTKHVGGLTFLRCGRFGCSWYTTKRS